MVQWVEGRVTGNHRWTDELYSLQVDADVQPFRAGQFTRLALDIDGERVARPYSYVNAPHERPLEFYFITIPHGPLTERLSGLRAGDALWLSERAAGTFTLAQVPEAEQLWLLATGTALGPFLSLLKTDEPWQRFSRIVLAHAVRTPPELTYQDDIRRFEEQHPGQFQMVPFVSREDTDFAIRDRIPGTIRNERLERLTGLRLTPETSQVMICGNPDMVRDTTQELETRGFRKNRRSKPGHITTENYW